MRVRALGMLLGSLLLVACSEETPVTVADGALADCTETFDTVVLTLYRARGGSTDCRQCIYCGECEEVGSRSVCLPAAVAANEAEIGALIRGTQFDAVLLNEEYCLAVALLDVDGAVECSDSQPQDDWRAVVLDRGTAGACLMTPASVRPDGPNAVIEVGEVACGGLTPIDGCVLQDPSRAGTREHCCDPTNVSDVQCTADRTRIVECDADRIGVLSTVCAAGTSCHPERASCVCDERSFPRCGPGVRTVELCSGGEIAESRCAVGECDPASPTSCLTAP